MEACFKLSWSLLKLIILPVLLSLRYMVYTLEPKAEGHEGKFD